MMTGPWVGGPSTAWRTFSSRKLNFLVVGDFGEVLCFDVAKEKFWKIPGPAQLERVAVDLLYLALFEGKLVLLFMNFPERLFRIWSINDDSSWTVLFDVPFNPAYEGKFYHIKPLKHMPDGCLLMYDDFHGELISCDYRVKEPKHIIFLGHLRQYDAFPFTPDIKFDVTTRGDETVRLSEVQDEGGCYVDAWSSNFVPHDDSLFSYGLSGNTD